MTDFWILVLAGFGVGVLTGWVAARGPRRREVPSGVLPPDADHVLDLLCRAHGGTAACLVVEDSGNPVVAARSGTVAPALMDRLTAAARLAMGDGREHVLRDGSVVVAVGDGDLGGAVALEGTDPPPERVAAAGRDLRRLVAEFRVARAPGGRLGVVRGVADWVAAAPHSVEGLAYALAQAVRAATGRPAGVALRDRMTHTTVVEAVSHGADRMLVGMVASPESAVGRACAGDIPVVGGTLEELLGRAPLDRRTRGAGGTAFPLRDGREGIGALIVFGDRHSLDPSLLERVLWLTVDAGPRLASALEVRAAEYRALTDALTGLPNRRALERAMARWAGTACAMLCVDIDHFKQFNDSYGHVAGDAALRHVAQVFRRTLRENDLAARIGGEEFALWLPDTPLALALEVGNRVRARVAGSALHWDGSDLTITCSVGVAAVPESCRRVENLLGAADAALYQAKRAGRNRVHASLGSGESA